MKTLTTIYKVGQNYSYKGEATSKITEVICGKYGRFITLENGNIVSVCK